MERQRKQLESSLKEVEYLFSCEEIIRSTGEFCSSLRKRGRAKLCFSSCTPLSVGATSDEGRMIRVDESPAGAGAGEEYDSEEELKGWTKTL
ncbi:hypothetical protein BDBG_03323 [Blastomyces gilchristii SLH14081]|uniref:Uncharacterized protein n=1 Tax=Blastomyces gilchristii (strain SLH14081) TaxID=559298 RepID=A0A179UGR7_BLAGS|nr:uncharacterized protein BDBG_03323 [Blastomyces gilchristii SLH14081]OAT07236.1 hypothetical protein BDBG_03323 [Blastomyces gilchristii SLH14081]